MKQRLYTKISLRVVSQLFFSVGFLVFTAVALSHIVSAGLDSGNQRTGYFTGEYALASTGDLAVLPHQGFSDPRVNTSDNALNATAILNARDANGGANTASGQEAGIDQFFAQLQSDYYLSPVGRVGASYIILTLLGRPTGTPGNTSALDPSAYASLWSDAKSRLEGAAANLRINFEAQVSIGAGSGNDQQHYLEQIGGNQATNDVAWYSYAAVYGSNSTRTRTGISISDGSGGTAYAIWYYCGNPIGSLAGLPQNAVWNLSATSAVNQATAKPGDTLSWTNQLINNGPNPVNTTIYSNVALSGFTNGWQNLSPVAGGNNTSNGPGVIRNITDYSQYTVQQSDVGNTLCENVQYDPTDSAGDRNGRGPAACTSVPYNYSITPSARVASISGSSSTTVALLGQTVTWQHTATNNGPTKTDRSVTISYNQGVVVGSVPAGTNPGSVNVNSLYTITQGDVGKTVCRNTIVTPSSSSNSGPATSANACVSVPYAYTVTPLATVTSISGTTSKNTAIPGQTITWQHKVTNNGPTKTDQNISDSYVQGGTISKSLSTLLGGSLPGASVSANSTYPVTQNDVGKQVCRATRANPGSRNSATVGGAVTSSTACVNVPYNYKITPTAKVTLITGELKTNVTVAKPGDVITWQHTATNNGPTKTDVVVTIYNLQNGVKGAKGSLKAGSFPGVSSSANSTYLVTQNDVGTTICRATVVTPGQSGSNASRTSATACVYVPYNYKITTTVKVASIQGEPTPNVTIAKPGDVINWTHTASNLGPTKTKEAVSVYFVQNSPSNATGPKNTIKADTNPTVAPAVSISFSETYPVTQDDVGKTVCRATQASPGSRNDTVLGGPVTSAYVCVTVPYNYTLTPTVSLDHTSAEAGTTVTALPTVANSGPTKSRSTQWQVSELIVGPGNSLPNQNGGVSPSKPCTFFTPSQSCAAVANGTGTSVFSTSGSVLSGSSLNNYAIVIPDDPVGTKVCVAFSVQPSSANATTWVHSALKCVVIGKKPKVTISGGDLSVGQSFSGFPTPASLSGVQTSQSTKLLNNIQTTFGSWDEYAIFAPGQIVGMGSGAAFQGGLQQNALCNYSTLSFTNAGSSGCSSNSSIGGYIDSQTLPDITSRYPVVSSTPSLGSTINIASTKPQGVYTATGNVTITGGGAGSMVPAGEWFVLNAPNANVTITGNIDYTTATLHNLADIPQVIILANNITIADSVTNVDAWLIARGQSGSDGVLSTCSNVAQTANACNQPLTVNGPVMAQKLNLWRTAGSGVGAASGDPAEIFNLPADTYLWGYLQANETARVQTVYTTELPPRF